MSDVGTFTNPLATGCQDDQHSVFVGNMDHLTHEPIEARLLISTAAGTPTISSATDLVDNNYGG